MVGCFWLSFNFLRAPECPHILHRLEFSVLFPVLSFVPVPGSFRMAEHESESFESGSDGKRISGNPDSSANHFNVHTFEKHNAIQHLADFFGNLLFVFLSGFGKIVITADKLSGKPFILIVQNLHQVGISPLSGW